jgi:hypothetical protein
VGFTRGTSSGVLFIYLVHFGHYLATLGVFLIPQTLSFGKIIRLIYVQFHSISKKSTRKKRKDRNPIKENGLRSALTPWIHDWNYDVNQLRGDKEFDWEHDDVPFLDIGEPVDEYNTWEIEWAKEKVAKRLRQLHVREKRSRRALVGPLKAAGRRKFGKKDAESRQRNTRGQFCFKGIPRDGGNILYLTESSIAYSECSRKLLSLSG